MRKIIALTTALTIISGFLPHYVSGQELSAKLMTMGTPSYEKPTTPADVKRKLTLSDCYQLALVQSEKIAIDSDQIKIAEARFLTALGTITPHVAFLSRDYQEEKVHGTDIADLQLPKTSVRRFNVTQTLFDGFKTIAAVKQSRFERIQYINERIRGEQLLLLDVANAFYLLIEKREDIKAVEKTRVALAERVKELIGRSRLGKSRPSEIVYAKAQLYNIQASLEVAENQETIVRQLLEFLIGWPVGELADTYEFPNRLKEENYYVAKSPARPDVAATEYAWHASRENIRVIDSEFLPNAKLEGNYYTQRTDFDKGVNWDVALAVSVPIFEGTDVLGRSKEANLQADQDWQTFHLTKRRAPYEIEDAYTTLTTAMLVSETLRKAYSTARFNYHLQKRDYVRRLVNNLDVLTSIQNLDDTERNYIHALYEAKRQYWNLRVAVGRSGTESLSDTF